MMAKPRLEVKYLLRGFSTPFYYLKYFTCCLPHRSDYAWILSSQEHSSEKPADNVFRTKFPNNY